MCYFEKDIEAEEGQDRAAPDHQRAFPSEGAGKVALAAPGNQKSWVVLAFHQNHWGMRIEAAGRDGRELGAALWRNCVRGAVWLAIDCDRRWCDVCRGPGCGV